MPGRLSARLPVGRTRCNGRKEAAFTGFFASSKAVRYRNRAVAMQIVLRFGQRVAARQRNGQHGACVTTVLSHSHCVKLLIAFARDYGRV